MYSLEMSFFFSPSLLMGMSKAGKKSPNKPGKWFPESIRMMGEVWRKQVQGLVSGHPWPVSWAQLGC